MAKFLKLEIDGKEYLVGFSNRTSVLAAERAGFMKILNKLEEAPVENSAKLLKYGLMEKQPEITDKECEDIYAKIAEMNAKDNEEEIRIGDITEFIMNQYLAFSGAPTGKKKQKKLEIVEM